MRKECLTFGQIYDVPNILLSLRYFRPVKEESQSLLVNVIRMPVIRTK